MFNKIKNAIGWLNAKSKGLAITFWDVFKECRGFDCLYLGFICGLLLDTGYSLGAVFALVAVGLFTQAISDYLQGV